MDNAKNHEACPVCGEKTRRNTDLVCPSCYRSYRSDAGAALAKGEVITLGQWTAPRVEARLEAIRHELQEKQETYTDLQEEVKSDAYQAIRDTLKGQTVPRDVFNTGMKNKAQALWKEKGGHRLHYEVKTLETEVAFLEGLLVQLHQNDSSREESSDEQPEEAPKTFSPEGESTPESDAD